MAVLIGGSGNDVLNGTVAIDTLRGLGGNDTLNGLAGNDTLDGGTGSDRMVGAAGNDTYVVDSAGDTVVEASGGGTDLVLSTIALTLAANVERLTLQGDGNISGTGNNLANVIIGNTGNNALDGGTGNDSLNGGGGNDLLTGGAGNDVLNGAGGSDTAVYGLAGGAVTINLGDATAQNTGGAGIDTLISVENAIGSAFEDELTGNGGANILDGAEGNDNLVGGAGNDTYVINVLDDAIFENANEGTDTVLTTLSFDLSAAGSNLPDVENVSLLGGANRNITGNDAANFLVGNGGNNSIAGGDGDDSLVGGAGNDRLNGGLGDDRLDGGLGRDSMAGGDGNDTYVVDHQGDVVVEGNNAGTDTLRSSISLSLSVTQNIEAIVLTGTRNLTVSVFGDIDVTGNDGDNYFRISSAGAGGTIIGGLGNDTFDLNTGPGTVMVGGLGNDTYIVADATILPVENAGEGTDTIDANEAITITLPDNVENFRGSGDVDVATGNGAANLMGAGGGNDSLFGLGGNDTLIGGNGADLLVGGAGVDGLFGGSAADQFRFTALGDIGAVATNVVRGLVSGDGINDFVTGQDILLFDDAAFDTGANNLPFGSLTEGTHFSVIDVAYDGTNPGENDNFDAGVETFVFSTVDRILYYDPNGAGAGYRVVVTVQDGATINVEDIAMA